MTLGFMCEREAKSERGCMQESTLRAAFASAWGKTLGTSLSRRDNEWGMSAALARCKVAQIVDDRLAPAAGAPDGKRIQSSCDGRFPKLPGEFTEAHGSTVCRVAA